MHISNRQKGYLCAAAAVAIWSGFILVSRQGGLSPLSSYDVIAIRYATSAVLLLPVWLFLKPFNLFQPRFLVSALIGGLAYALFAFAGFESAPASHAAILLPGLLPLLIILLSRMMIKQRTPLSKYVGVGVISLGIALLFWQALTGIVGLTSGHLYLVAAALCWALFSVLIARWNIQPWEATISLALVTSLLFIPVYWLFLPGQLSLDLAPDIALQAFYQGVMATIVQMLLYVKAVQLIGASGMGSMMAVVPLIAGFGAIPLFDEPLHIELGLALLFVSIGVWLANTSAAPSCVLSVFRARFQQ